MARIKKEKKYGEFLAPLTGEELKTLISEAQVALKIFEKENSAAKKMEKAVKFRDTLKIGNKVSFKDAGQVVSASVVGITVDKVQVDLNGKKKSLNLLKLITE